MARNSGSTKQWVLFVKVGTDLHEQSNVRNCIVMYKSRFGFCHVFIEVNKYYY